MADNRYGVNISPESEAILEEVYAPRALDLEAVSPYMPTAGIPAASTPQGGGNSNLRAGMQYLMDRYGLQPHHAAAMIGNFAQESGGRTGAEGGNILPGEAYSYGLAQHNRERLHGGKGYVGLLPYAKQQGKDPSDLYTQLDYVMQELQGPERKAFDALLQSPDLESATTAFGRAYERPSEKYANYQNRIAQARAYLGGGAEASPYQMVTLDNGQSLEVERGMSLDTVASMLKQNGINAVPLRNFQTPRGTLEVPYNMTDEQVTGLLQKQQPALLMPPGKKPPETGMLPAGIAGLESGVGAAGVGIGEVLQRAGTEFESPTLTGWGQKAAEFGKGMERRAEETYRPPTEEEIKQMGPLDWASAKIGQPASYMLGRVGAPLIAGAVTRMPSVAMAGLGAQGVANVVEPAQKAGVAVSNPELAMHAMVDTALNFFRFPAIGPLRNLVVEGMSPALRESVQNAIRSGNTEAAQQLISGRVMQVAKAIPENFATNLIANVGQEANVRAALGKELTSPEALKEYKEQIEPTALMALPFGVHQGLAARAGQMRQVEDMAAQHQIEQARLQQEQQQQRAPETPEEPEDLGIELPPVQEPTIRGQEAPTTEAPAPAPPAPKPYYDTLGLSSKSNVYKELKTRDIDDPLNAGYIADILDNAIANPRLKVKDVDAMTALRDQLRPPKPEVPPAPPTTEVPSAQQITETGAPDGSGGAQPIVRQKGRRKAVSGKGVEPSGQGIEAPKVGGEEGKVPEAQVTPSGFKIVELPDNRIRITGFAEAGIDTPTAQKNLIAAKAPRGIITKDGLEFNKSRQADVLSVLEGMRIPVEPTKVAEPPKAVEPPKAAEPPVPPTEEAPAGLVEAVTPTPTRKRVTRKPPKGSTPEETDAAVAATEAAKEPPAAEVKPPVEEVKPPEVEEPPTPEQDELTKLRAEVEQAKAKHQELKAAQTKAFHGRGARAEAKFAELEKQIAENRTKGIAAKRRIAELEHEQHLKEQAAAEEVTQAEPVKTVARKKLTEEATPADIEAEAEKGAAAIAKRLEQMKAEKEAQKKADEAVAEAEGKTKKVEVVTPVEPAVETPTAQKIKTKIDEVTSPKANLERRRAKAAKPAPKKVVPKPVEKPALGKPSAVEKPYSRPELAGVYGEHAPHPQWVADAPKTFNYKDPHAAPIYSHGDYGLVRLVNKARPEFRIIHKLPNGRFVSTQGIGASELSTLREHERPPSFRYIPADTLRDLVKAESAAKLDELHMEKLYPEGPFTGADTKHNVLTSESMPKELGEIVHDWTKLLNITDAKIFLTNKEDMHNPDAREKYGLYGDWSFVQRFGERGEKEGELKGIAMYVNRDKGHYAISLHDTSNVTPRLLETLAHELGHVFEKHTLNHAPLELQQAIFDEYAKFRDKYVDTSTVKAKVRPGKKYLEFLEERRPFHAVAEMRAGMTEKGTTERELQELSGAQLDYLLGSKGFAEWFADQVSKWATSSAKPQTAVEKFFKSIADGLRKLYASLTGADTKYLPTPLMKRYLDARESATVADVKAILSGQSPLADAARDLSDREYIPEEEQLRGRNITQRPATGPEAAARQVRNAVATADNVLNKPSYLGGLFANLRTSVIDEFAHLSRALRHLPTFDPNGKARADMLASQQRMERQFIAEALKTGFVRRSPSGFFYIEESDKNLSKLLEEAGKLKGLRDPYQALSDVLRSLVGEHWIKETERLREEADKYSDASAKWKAHAKTLKKYEDRRAAEDKARMYKRRAEEIKARAGEGEGEGLEKLVTREDIAAAKALMNRVPGMKDIVDGIHKNMESLVDLHLATGMIDAATAKKWKNNPYIPLYKSMEELQDSLTTARSGRVFGGAKSLPRVHQIMGGTHAVDVFENLQKHTAMMTMAAFKNNVRRAAVDQLGMFGASRLLEPGEQQRNKQAVLVRVDGKDQYHEVNDPYIFNALQMAQPLTNELLHMLSIPTKALRAGALMNPGYWYRQLLRDPILANLVSQTGIVTPFDTVKEFAKIVGGLTVGRAPKEYEVLRKHGLTGVVDPSLTDPIKFSEAIGKKSFAPVKAVKTWVAIHEAADSATRVAVYKQALKDAKKKGYTGQTAEDYAVMRAREIINFSNRGASNAVNAWRQVVPFFGAALNGLDVVARAATGTNLSPAESRAAKQLFWGRAMAISTVSMALALYWAQNPQYGSMNDDERANNWIMGFDKDGRPYKYPIPPDVGFFFKVLPEAMIHKIMGTPSHEESGQLETLKNSFLDTVVPPGLFPPIPQALVPIIEHVTNRNLHGGYDIEPKGDANLPKEMRGRSKATRLARVMSDEFGAELGWSPAQIDHMFTASFGGAYGAMSMVAELVLRNYEDLGYDDRDLTEKVPWIKAVVGNPRNIGEKAEMYDAFNTARGLVSGYRRAVSSMEPGMAERFTTPEGMGKYALARPMKTIVDAVTKVDNELRRMRNQKVSGPEAEKRYDQLKNMKDNLMKQAAMLSRRVRNEAADDQDLYENQRRSVQQMEDNEEYDEDWSE